MATLNMQTAYADHSIDPGPVHTSGHVQVTALAHLVTAAQSGELPVMPDRLARALALSKQVTAYRTDIAITEAVSGISGYVRTLAHDVLDGKATPPDLDTLSADALAAHLDAERRQATSLALDGLTGLMRQALPSIVAEADEEMLAGLRGALEAVLADARHVAQALAGLDLTDTATMATATKAQREARVALPDIARRYNRIRMMQRDVYAAGTRAVVGSTDHSASYGWREAFATGIHEFERITPADPGPPTDLPTHLRILAVARRPDVWLPTHKQMERALHVAYAPKPEVSEEQEEREASKPKVTDRRSASLVAALN